MNPLNSKVERHQLKVNECTDGQGRPKGAILITHGWNSDANGWVKDMADNICSALAPFNSCDLPVAGDGPYISHHCRTPYFDVLSYDWRKDAKVAAPMIASTNAVTLGRDLALTLTLLRY
jgi:hypothetical protein